MPASDRSDVYRRFPRESGTAFRQLLTGRVRVDADRVNCPVLYVRGDADRVVSRRQGRRIAERYGGDYIEHAGHGHWLVEEPGWERPAADILSWIESASSSSATWPGNRLA